MEFTRVLSRSCESSSYSISPLPLTTLDLSDEVGPWRPVRVRIGGCFPGRPESARAIGGPQLRSEERRVGQEGLAWAAWQRTDISDDVGPWRQVSVRIFF